MNYGLNALSLPEGAQLLSVEAQFGNIQLWALVDEYKPHQTRTVFVAGTGHEIPTQNAELRHIGTTLMNNGNFVWHAFEVVAL